MFSHMYLIYLSSVCDTCCIMDIYNEITQVGKRHTLGSISKKSVTCYVFDSIMFLTNYFISNLSAQFPFKHFQSPFHV